MVCKILKEASSRPDRRASLLPKIFQAITCGMEGEGQQVHGGEGSGQAFIPVAEVVCQVIAVVFQHIEALVFDLPAGSGASGKLDHILYRHRQAGHESPVIRGFSLFVGNGYSQPADGQRILSVSQRNPLDPAVAIGQAALASTASASGWQLKGASPR